MIRHSAHIQARGALALVLAAPVCLGWATTADEIFTDDFEGFDHVVCDAGLASDSSDPMQYAAAMDVCKTTTESDTDWGLISATLTLASGSGTPASVSYSIRPSFGSGNTPRFGSSMVVLSTGAAAATGQTSPSFVPFQGDITGTSSAVPADWLTAHGGIIPVAPGCPPAFNTTAFDPVMLTLRIRVPPNANSFSLAANFFSSDYPEWVCSAFNDLFVALLDSGFAGSPANPADKNLAINALGSPLNVNSGALSQCVDGQTGCSDGNVGTMESCLGTSGLIGTGMDTPDSGYCDSNSVVGGGTDWLVISGNVVPGEIMQLRLAIWDTGDGTYDSLILLDNFRWSQNVVTPGMTRN